jgi:hypothetical protein
MPPLWSPKNQGLARDEDVARREKPRHGSTNLPTANFAGAQNLCVTPLIKAAIHLQCAHNGARHVAGAPAMGCAICWS